MGCSSERTEETRKIEVRRPATPTGACCIHEISNSHDVEVAVLTVLVVHILIFANHASRSDARISKLDKIGFTWRVTASAWESQFQLLKRWREIYGHTCVPISEKQLGSWVSKQRHCYKRTKLSYEKVVALNSIGFVWSSSDAEWENKFQQLCKWKIVHGHTVVPFSEGGLGWWANTQRIAKRRGRLQMSREAKLTSIGFVWDPTRWRSRKNTCKEFRTVAVSHMPSSQKITEDDRLFAKFALETLTGLPESEQLSSTCSLSDSPSLFDNLPDQSAELSMYSPLFPFDISMLDVECQQNRVLACDSLLSLPVPPY